MKTAKILARTKLLDFLKSLQVGFEVILPVKRNGDLLFSSLDGEQLDIGLKGKTAIPPKDYVFPQREKLFTFKTLKDNKIKIEHHESQAKRVIWGIRPCDLQGIKTLDTIYLSDHPDNFYQSRRQNILLLGLNCNECCETGFCHSLQTGPFAKDGFDLMFTDLGDSFLVTLGSEASKTLLSNSHGFFTEATAGDKRKADELEQASIKTFKRSVDAKTVKARLSWFWDDDCWAKDSESCILCGGCNWVCPTCHCFNIEDIATDERTSIRVRYWDSCQLGGFTQMAVENTRRTQAERYRQRVFHKFSYTPDKYHGALGCTGCGRCIEVCPGEIDFTVTLGRITRQ
ncbi:MAG: 4Fe-4S dicluster domain-containing protein [Dehalococcoidales bacterium]|nr:4Fe-4S dicluster domain-containing protein [Dehalococcoidales bacterium]